MSGFNSCIDAYTDMPIRMEYDHHEIHNGSSYIALYSLTRNNTEIVEIRFETSSPKQANMIINIDCALAATFELFIDTTKTHDSGNAIVPFNRNQNSSNTSTLTVCHTPSGTQTGTGSLLQYVGSANAGGASSIGGSAGSRDEIVFKENTAYLVRVTSRANSNSISIILDWYEHTPKNT